MPLGFTHVPGWAARSITFEQLAYVLPWAQTSRKMYGREIKTPRLTCGGGAAAYSYAQQTHEPSPIPRYVDRVMFALAMQPVHEGKGLAFNTYVGNYYRSGLDSIAWHSDDEPELGPDPIVASVSFGASRRFLIRHKVTRVVHAVDLADGDLLIMGAGTQAVYEHSVPKRNAPILYSERISLTFRTVVK